MTGEQYVGVHIAARRLGCSRETIYRFIREGVLPARQVAPGKRYRIPVRELDRLSQRSPHG